MSSLISFRMLFVLTVPAVGRRSQRGSSESWVLWRLWRRCRCLSDTALCGVGSLNRPRTRPATTSCLFMQFFRPITTLGVPGRCMFTCMGEALWAIGPVAAIFHRIMWWGSFSCVRPHPGRIGGCQKVRRRLSRYCARFSAASMSTPHEFRLVEAPVGGLGRGTLVRNFPGGGRPWCLARLVAYVTGGLCPTCSRPRCI